MDRTYVHQIFDFLHQHPEIGLKEYQTSAFLASELKKYGYQVFENVGNSTGVIGVLNSNKPGKVIALRADMDALPYVINGKHEMRHTCGHDAHSSMVMAAARYFGENGLPSGCLKIIFQPAEEILKGADIMSKSGMMNDIDELIGLHIRAKDELKTGQACCGVYHGASAKIRFVVHGVNAHAARPHQGVNAIETALAIINGIYMIKVNPSVSHSIKVTRLFGGGETVNIIPDTCEICFDTRAQTNEVMKELKEKARAIAESTAKVFGASLDVDIDEGVPAAEFTPDLMDSVKDVISDVLGEENSMPPIVTPGGEDFHFYIQKLPHIKTAFIGLGSDATPGLHHQNMSFDHNALEYGVDILTAVVKKRLN